jgi:hypothetical protein
MALWPLTFKLGRAGRRKQAEPRAHPSQTTAVLKPYSGVGSTVWSRRIPIALIVLLGLLGVPYGFFYALYTPWLLVPLVVPIAALMAIAIWALPDFERAPVEALQPLLFTFFIAMIVWPNYLALQLPGLPWITASRLTGVPLVVIFFYCVSCSPQLRDKIALIVTNTTFAWKFLLIFVFTQFIGLAFSADKSTTMSRMTLFFTDELTVFFISCYVFFTQGWARKATFILWILALVVGGIGLVEFTQQHVLWAGHIPAILAVHDESVLRVLAGSIRGNTGAYRAVSVFTTGLGLAEYMAWTVPFALHLAASAHNKLAVRIGAVASLPFTLAVILATDSRLGLIGFFVGVVLYLLFWAALQMRRGESLFAPAIILGYPALMVVLVAMSFVVGRIRNRVWGTGQYDDSTQSRTEQIQLAIPHVLSNPLGHGAGNAGNIVHWTAPDGFVSLDSYYIGLIVDEGVLGLIAYTAMFVTLVVAGARCATDYKGEDEEIRLLMPLAVCFAVFLVIKLVFNEDDMHPIMFMLAGMASALIARARLENVEDPRARRDRLRDATGQQRWAAMQ